MVIDVDAHKSSNEELLERLSLRENHESIAAASITTDILKRLNISIEKLPQKCQNILQDTAEKQSQINLVSTDDAAISLIHSKQLSEKLDQEYEILKLEQKNKELQMKIDRNNKFIKSMRDELVLSKESLMSQNPNPENIQDHIRQLKQKLVSYEESYEKAQAKYLKLNIPDAILPESLTSQINCLLALQQEAEVLRQSAEEVALAKVARDTLAKLARVN